MKRFQSRWGTLQRLAMQRKQLAELSLLKTQQQHAAAQQHYDAAVVQRDHDLAALEQLAATPFQTQLLCASQHFLKQQAADLATAAQAVQVASQQQLQAMLEWQRRSVQYDQNTALVQAEREQFAEESIRHEQVELDESVQRYRQSVPVQGDA